MRFSTRLVSSLMIFGAFASGAIADDWKSAQAPIMTRWAKEVSPENALPEYPRPQMVREKWQNLNGLWDYAIKPKDEAKPESFDGKILVPFAAESALSGVMKTVGEANRLWYHRTFSAPDLTGRRLLLHFGAVDWRATVWLNGKEVGRHEGGYDPFSFDVTDHVNKGDEEQHLVVAVWDPSDKGTQPRGKQVTNPHGIWYTPVTGIWQTVWIEPVSISYVGSLKLVPDVEKKQVRVTAACVGADEDGELRVEVVDPTTGKTVGTQTGRPGKEIVVPLEGETKLWSPEQPHLYDVRVLLGRRENGVVGSYSDEVKGYFGLRDVKLAKADDGFNRLFLNGKPVFQFGPLDQGWWPDGLYTAPTDEALKYDIEVTKQLGFNMARKHVKVEPARWYYWCDKLGLMVWQDMPSGDENIDRGAAKDLVRSAESEAIYRKEWQAIMDANRHWPCIVCWVPFNEGWGQFKTNEILAWTKKYDPTRLVDGPSGWQDRGEGDMLDMHMYPGPGMFPAQSERATVLGEYGGLGLPVDGHLWKAQNNWGYRTYKTREELVENYKNLGVQLPPLIGEGLAAAVYTQTTDVEIEVNGLMTYDRAVIKLPADEIAAVNKLAYGKPTKPRVVVPTSEREGLVWRYTTEKPGEGWQDAKFDDSAWKEGPGGFGTEMTPDTTVHTTWSTPDIWLRRAVKIDGTLNSPALRLYHDENAQVFVNGVKVAERRGYVTGYTLVPIGPEARSAIRSGENVIAVHCRQTQGGQYIDVGLVDLLPAAK